MEALTILAISDKWEEQNDMNNIFKYATKELSQDAFLCWLANWYNYDSPLKNLSKEFVDLIMSRTGVVDFELKSLSVLRQYNHIDVLLVINQSIGVVIEDKTFTSEHGNQISRYATQILAEPIVTPEATYSLTDVVCVYFKTAEYIKTDDVVCRNNEIVKLTRGDMLSLIKPYIEKSEILFDYYENLKDLDDTYVETEEAYLSYNYNEALRYSYMQWRYLKESFSEENEKGILELPCDMSLPEGLDPIEQGTSFGIPYTWYWFLEFSRNIEEERQLKYGRYLGYRIDTDNEGTFISLRMYCRYDKEDEEAKNLQRMTCLRLRQYIPTLVRERCPQAQKHLFVIRYNESAKTANYECEIFKCYFNENVFDKESNDDFIKMLCIIRNNLQIFA